MIKAYDAAFQSAPLLRGAIAERGEIERKHAVSIRAPLARGDSLCDLSGTLTPCFNPRPSCEGRWYYQGVVVRFLVFQSAPLLRGAMIMVGIFANAA